MSRIKNAFADKKAFIGFITAGDPSFADTKSFILAMEKAGLDLIELGVPFSDPVAEGVAVQEANIRALNAGATLDGVLDTVEDVRKSSQIPLVLLTYLNPLFSYGYEAFFARCKVVGVDAVLIPDLPFDEKGEISDISKAHGIEIISLFAPFDKARVEEIAKDAEGYAYIMPPPSHHTGLSTKEVIDTISAVSDIPAVIELSRDELLSNPDAVADADGFIIGGNVFVGLIETYGKDAVSHIKSFISEVKSIL